MLRIRFFLSEVDVGFEVTGHRSELFVGGDLLFGALPFAQNSLSGFLVASSLVRSASLADFFIRRAVRIVPALAAEIALSALVIGPLLTAGAARVPRSTMAG